MSDGDLYQIRVLMKWSDAWYCLLCPRFSIWFSPRLRMSLSIYVEHEVKLSAKRLSRILVSG